MFRDLTRKNKQITDAECIEVLTRETRGILAVNGDEGYPYAMPMNHFYHAEDGCIYFHCGRGGHREESLLRSDKVSVCERGTRAAEEWAYSVRSVIVFGRIEIIDDTDTVIRIARALSRKFTDDEAYIQGEIDSFASKTLLLRLTPAHMCGKLVKEA
ncbi:MAG: pyridoxamine 5'-phosphate oxidase family protein [Ruminococcaceae bacterium]|nr:pyridoxamine 5'-phosphate oxidase family protein [Oscillospiraceae bacterium]